MDVEHVGRRDLTVNLPKRAFTQRITELLRVILSWEKPQMDQQSDTHVIIKDFRTGGGHIGVEADDLVMSLFYPSVCLSALFCLVCLVRSDSFGKSQRETLERV